VITLPDQTATLITDSAGVLNIGSGQLVKDASGNLGVNVTPSAWATLKPVQFSGGASLAGFSNTGYLNANAYFDGSWRYIATATAGRYEVAADHKWFSAASGTAGNAITFTQAMTLDTSNRLSVNRTTGGGTLNVKSQTNSFISEFYHYSNDASVGSITTSTTATTYGTSSDYRLKNVIGPVVDAGARIDALEPVEYEWKSDGSRTRGFLAHQFQEVYAGSVTGSKDAVDAEGNPVYQAMQAGTSEVIADLVAEIKSLRARVEALEGTQP